jgi:PAS domain-containing protein
LPARLRTVPQQLHAALLNHPALLSAAALAKLVCSGIVFMEQQKTIEERSVPLREVAAAIPELLWINAPDGRQQYVNRRWCEYTGQTPEDAAAGEWASFLHPDDRDVVWRIFRQSMESGRAYEVKCRYRRHDGA